MIVQNGKAGGAQYFFQAPEAEPEQKTALVMRHAIEADLFGSTFDKHPSGSESESPSLPPRAPHRRNRAGSQDRIQAPGASNDHRVRNDLHSSLLAVVDNFTQIPEARRRELGKAAHDLSLDLLRGGRPTGHYVYVMEGATGVIAAEGRPSTDPDENMALKMISFLVKAKNMSVTVLVPDAANKKQTLAFLKRVKAKSLNLSSPGHRANKIDVISMDDNESITRLSEEHAHFNIMVLGPPLGFSSLLLKGEASVSIMGSAREVNGVLDLQSLSTNTRSPESYAFISQILKREHRQFPSSVMGPSSSLSLSELEQGTSLITDSDKQHWVRNSVQQILGIGPYYLLQKRIQQSGATSLFLSAGNKDEIKPFSLRQGKQEDLGLSFLPFLNEAKKYKVSLSTLLSVPDELGAGYEFLRDPDQFNLAKSRLTQIINAHQSEVGSRLNLARSSTCAIIESMSAVEAAAAFAALAMSFKNIYDEKTEDGWRSAGIEGLQWRTESFFKCYMKSPGRQIPYDAIVTLTPWSGLGATDEEKRALADKVLLALCSA